MFGKYYLKSTWSSLLQIVYLPKFTSNFASNNGQLSVEAVAVNATQQAGVRPFFGA